MVASIFVNPMQFAPGEDLDRYPRTFAADLEMCAEQGVDIVFAPSVEEVYPGGDPQVRVDPGPLGAVLTEVEAYEAGRFDALSLLGERAWWLPRWLDRLLPSFDVEGSALAEELAGRYDREAILLMAEREGKTHLLPLQRRRPADSRLRRIVRLLTPHAA